MICVAVTFLPYRFSFAPSSGPSVVPDRETPANTPCALEYESISALIAAFVEASASRPTGPAATLASRTETPVELDALKGSPVVQTAVRSEPTPDGLNDAYFSQGHLGSPVRGICTPGSAWGDESKRPCLLGEAWARKRLRPQGSARATATKPRPYQPS